MGYGSGPALNGHGFAFQGPPWAGGVLPDNPASRKRRGGICTILSLFFFSRISHSFCNSSVINHYLYVEH
jgi:hypothetical protein